VKLYEVRTTEYNGEQEYSNSHLLAAKNLKQAQTLARAYFDKWYEDGKGHHASPDDPDRFEFVDGCITLKIKGITEITLDDWKNEQVELYSINKLPKTMLSCRRCRALLTACEYIRDCLDVGGEQSRQFAEEIAYLRKVIREARR